MTEINSLIKVFNSFNLFDKFGAIGSILTIITVLILPLIKQAILKSKKEGKDEDFKKFEIEEKRSKERRKELLHTVKEAKENLITINKIEKLQKLQKENKVLQRNSKEVIEMYQRLPPILQYFGQLGGLSRIAIIGIFPFFYMTYFLQINENIWHIIGGLVAIFVIGRIYRSLIWQGYIFGNNEKSVKFTNSLTKLRWLPIVICFVLMMKFFIIGSIIFIYVYDKMCTIILENYKNRGVFLDSLGYVVVKWVTTIIIVIGLAYLFKILNFSHFDFSDVSSIFSLYVTIICATVRIITHPLFLYAHGKYQKLCSDEGKEELINNSILLNILPQNRTIDYIQKLIDITINNRKVETLSEVEQIIEQRVRK